VQKEEADELARQKKLQDTLKLAEEVKARREAMRREAGLPAESESSRR